MTLRLDDKWVWDFWFARDGDEHHIFYLQAPRSLRDPELRHRHATIGHAVSQNLSQWTVLPDALHPGDPGEWDDLATWTGSVINVNGLWHMLYTGISSREDGLIQRIGLATSEDLIGWRKHPANPVLEADPRWYEMLDLNRWRDQSWRDPWLFRTSDDAFVHALVTARSPVGPADAAGVVAHARSKDLITWEVLPPVTEPGDFAQVEVPQLVPVDDGYSLLISCLAEDHSQLRLARLGGVGQTGTFILSSPSWTGPYTAAARPLARPDRPGGTIYAGKLVHIGEDEWGFIGFRGDGDREFLGELIDPLPARFDGVCGFVVVDEQPETVRLAPEVRTLIAWGGELAQRHRDLALPDLRLKLQTEHDREMRRLGMGQQTVGAVNDYRLPVAGGEIALRVFSPEKSGPHPVLVHFHGGGFVFGTIDSVVNNAKCARICRDADCAVATVEYRLAPEHRFPTAPEDCYAALRFVVENAEELGIDANRVAVGGESAGANLAAAVALMARDRSGPSLVLQLLEVPVTDISAGAGAHPSVASFAVGYGLDQSEMEHYAAQYLASAADGGHPYASPLLAADLAGLPAAHVMTAEYDVLRDSGEAYAHRLREAGVHVTHQRMQGHTHGSSVLWPAWEPAAAWMEVLVGALARSFHQQREEVL